MSGIIEQNIGPISFLVDDPSEVSSIVVPWRRRWTSKTLDTTECCVL